MYINKQSTGNARKIAVFGAHESGCSRSRSRKSESVTNNPVFVTLGHKSLHPLEHGWKSTQ